LPFCLRFEKFGGKVSGGLCDLTFLPFPLLCADFVQLRSNGGSAEVFLHERDVLRRDVNDSIVGVLKREEFAFFAGLFDCLDTFEFSDAVI
jgi:hypothetical protein